MLQFVQQTAQQRMVSSSLTASSMHMIKDSGVVVSSERVRCEMNVLIALLLLLLRLIVAEATKKVQGRERSVAHSQRWKEFGGNMI